MNTLEFSQQWESASHEVEEVNCTAGLLRITTGPVVATRNEEEWSRTVRNETRVSAYPLALWLAGSWWRLRWEQLPARQEICTDWRLSHELASAGYGFLWPRIAFASEGDAIRVWVGATPPSEQTPVRYLVNYSGLIDPESFEHSLSTFIEETIARLGASGTRDNELGTLWAELCEERTNEKESNFRILEAMLGFDPGEAPDQMISKFFELADRAGQSATKEIVPICASSSPEQELQNVIRLSQSQGVRGRFELNDLAEPTSRWRDSQPWERGWKMATEARKLLRLNGQPLPDSALCELLGVSERDAFEIGAPSPAPLALAVEEVDRSVRYLFRRTRRSARRFEMARFVGDRLGSPNTEAWRPSTDTKTSRQRFQRAFAAELLCPIDSIREFVEEDYSPESIEDAAEHFGVGPLAIESQLYNHGVVPRPYYFVEDGYRHFARS